MVVVLDLFFAGGSSVFHRKLLIADRRRVAVIETRMRRCVFVLCFVCCVLLHRERVAFGKALSEDSVVRQAVAQSRMDIAQVKVLIPLETKCVTPCF